MDKVIKTIVRMMAPSVLFLVLYKFLGLQLSVLITCAISFLLLLLDVFKEKRITNSAIIGTIGLAFQVVSAFCVGYEKLYYVPALVQNCVIMFLVLSRCIRSKSVFLYVVKDFDFKIFKEMSDEELLPLNYLVKDSCEGDRHGCSRLYIDVLVGLSVWNPAESDYYCFVVLLCKEKIELRKKTEHRYFSDQDF